MGRTTFKFIFVLLALVAVSKFGSAEKSPFKEICALEIPSRSKDAVGGREFIRRTAKLSEDAREEAILTEVRKGNIPNFLRKLQAVNLNVVGRDGRKHTATVWVMPDYLAIGSDQDFVRIPMNPYTAALLAKEFGYSLPTTKLVDEIYKNSSLKLSPVSMQPTAQMSSNAYYLHHNETIERQMASYKHNGIAAGHKKDVVLSKRLQSMPGRVAIYGWHRTNGKPIQPLSLVHDASYADYSHGIRFVKETMLVDGRETKVDDILRDPVLSALLSNEGALNLLSYRQVGNRISLQN